jgi:hypothetical protein
MQDKPTRADLEAMRQEYGAGDERVDRGLPFNLDDDIQQAGQMVRFGMDPEEWARARGVPVEYARALLRHIE